MRSMVAIEFFKVKIYSLPVFSIVTELSSPGAGSPQECHLDLMQHIQDSKWHVGNHKRCRRYMKKRVKSRLLVVKLTSTRLAQA